MKERFFFSTVINGKDLWTDISVPKTLNPCFPFISQELSNIAWIRHLRTMFPVLFFIFLFLNVSLSIESAARDIPQMSVSEYFDIKVFLDALASLKTMFKIQ